MRKTFALLGLTVALVLAGCGGDGNDNDGETTRPGGPDPNRGFEGFHTLADARPFAGAAPLRVQFTAQDSDASGDVEYRWRFDDGTTSDEQNPVHTFKAGTYNVEMYARDERGASDSWNVVIGSWPPEVWAATRKRIANRRELRAQGLRTGKRRKETEQASLDRTRW